MTTHRNALYATSADRPEARPFARRQAPVAIALSLALLIAAGSAAAGQLGSIDVVTRPEGRVLPVYPKDGRSYIVGTPGQEYGIRVCNTTGERVLAVMSVDGVNIVSGETAAPSQTGYVLAPYQCADINGWRKNLASIAAFYFTELPDAYAARTGRPDNVGVIGVAFFRERPQRTVWKDSPRIAASPAPESAARQDASGAMSENRASDAASARKESAREPYAIAQPVPAPVAKIGTGHGRYEESYVQTTQFVRASTMPDETLAIQYDRRENLIAMGVLAPPSVARSANPFPAGNMRFVPDPPSTR